MFRPIVLSIAGLDPSAGAGLLADIKTCEAHEVVGMGACSAVTVQNDVDFENVKWAGIEDIKNQLKILIDRYKIEYVKIGIIESFDALEEIIKYLKTHNTSIKIIWDPILKTNTDFTFHKRPDRQQVIKICKEIYLITPNLQEASALFEGDNPEVSSKEMSTHCSVLLKGGHRINNCSDDNLYVNKNLTVLPGQKITSDKHGTGCVLSAAILSNLAKGDSLFVSCKKAKKYLNCFILSNAGMLGYHNAIRHEKILS